MGLEQGWDAKSTLDIVAVGTCWGARKERVCGLWGRNGNLSEGKDEWEKEAVSPPPISESDG